MTPEMPETLSQPGSERPSGAAGRPGPAQSSQAARRPYSGPALLLITGSREFADHQMLDHALNQAWNEALGRGFNQLVVVHGGARGADRLADGWARRRQQRGVESRRFRPDWDGPCTAECRPGHRRSSKAGGTYCPAEGNRRNQRMVEHVLASAVPGGALGVAFFVDGLACDGTHDCLRRIQAAGLPWRSYTAQLQAVAS